MRIPDLPPGIEPWTKPEVERLVRSALDPTTRLHGEAKGTLRTLFASQLLEVMSVTASFLGESTDATGGTMGSPRRPPDWMYLLMDRLTHSFLKGTQKVFAPPFSRREKATRAICRYMWHMIEYHS